VRMTDSARRTPGGPHAEAADRHPLAAALLSCLLCIIAGAPVRASALDAITAMPQTAEIADLTGYWQFIPIPLPERSEGSSKRTKPSFSNPSRAPVRPAEKGAQARRNGQASGPPSGQHSHPCRPRPERRHPRRHPASGRRRFGEPRPRRNRQARQSSHRRWRQGDRHFRPQSRDSLPRRAGAGKPAPAAPHLHINNVNAYHGRLKQWLNRFNGVATKNLPNYLGWRRALEAWGDKLEPPTWIKGAIGNGPHQQITL
jgi:hypothetical protein